MKSLRAKFAAAALVAIALIAAPAAANAYTPVAPGGTITVTPGGTVTVPFTGFAPEEPVSFTLTGENGAGASLASVRIAITTSAAVTKPADSDGAVSVVVTLPSNASGDYELRAVGAESGASALKVISVPAAAGTPGSLPATGVDSASLMGVWVGGGVLLLGGLAVTVFAVRRQRQTV